jgi:hypothetical protein
MTTKEEESDVKIVVESESKRESKGNDDDTSGPKSKSVASPIYIGFGILYLILTFCQGVCLWTASGQNNNLNDQTAKNSLTNYLYNWSWAIGILGVITLIVLVLYGFLGAKANLLKFLIYWLVLMFIVNLILLGFGFYFLSVVLNSTDYSSGSSNATNLKNTIIALLSFTGLILLIIIIMLVYYNYYGTSTYRISGFFGLGSDITPEDFFADPDIAQKLFSGIQCGKNFEAYKKQQATIKLLKNNFNLEDPNTQSALLNAVNLGKKNSSQKVKTLRKKSS